MGIFTTYTSNLFNALENSQGQLIAGTGIFNDPTPEINNVVIVNSIRICNIGDQTIRINLRKVKNQNTPPSGVQINMINQFEIQPYETVDLINHINYNVRRTETSPSLSSAQSPIVLSYEFDEELELPNISEGLFCYTNGVIQKFDCEVTYTILNETPMGC